MESSSVTVFIEDSIRAIEEALAETDASVSEVLLAVEELHRNLPERLAAPARRLIVAMQFHDLMSQRLRAVQSRLEAGRQRLLVMDRVEADPPQDIRSGQQARKDSPSCPTGEVEFFDP